MGSSSDFSVMQHAVPFFKQFDITARLSLIASAHRTPDRVHEEVRAAEEAGAVAIICAAGMAAHLAGVVAGTTNLPVIGVPLASGALDGLGALLSTVQMPAGIPVATVGVGKAGARNAAILVAYDRASSSARRCSAQGLPRAHERDGGEGRCRGRSASR